MDIYKKNELNKNEFCADIVIADVPYGNLAAWTNAADNSINILLHTIIPIIDKNTIIAIVYDKSQKINNQDYKRVRKHKIGHRIIEILKLK